MHETIAHGSILEQMQAPTFHFIIVISLFILAPSFVFVFIQCVSTIHYSVVALSRRANDGKVQRNSSKSVTRQLHVLSLGQMQHLPKLLIQQRLNYVTFANRYSLSLQIWCYFGMKKLLDKIVKAIAVNNTEFENFRHGCYGLLNLYK